MTPVLTAFAADRLIAKGGPRHVLPAVKAAADAGEAVTIFDDTTGQTTDFDLRGDLETVLARLPEPQKRGPGRPKLGVTAREVTLLPRHWDWLAGQPGGASVALRKLVEAALKDSDGPDRTRRARDAAYRFMTTMAGDRPGYEDAVRALFAGDERALEMATAWWPRDIRAHAMILSRVEA